VERGQVSLPPVACRGGGDRGDAAASSALPASRAQPRIPAARRARSLARRDRPRARL